MVEQNAKAALRISDRGYVLAEGRNRMSRGLPPSCFPIPRSAKRSSVGEGSRMIGQAIADGFLTGGILALGAIGVSLSLADPQVRELLACRVAHVGRLFGLTFIGFATAGAARSGRSPSAGPSCSRSLSAGLDDGRSRPRRRPRSSSGASRSRHANCLTMVFASFGVALILRNLVLLIWGPDAQYYSE